MRRPKEAGLARDLCRVCAGWWTRWQSREQASAEAGQPHCNANAETVSFPPPCEQEFSVQVDRQRAPGFGACTSCPRSTSPVPGRHEHSRILEARLPYVAGYELRRALSASIHPIGRRLRKGAIIFNDSRPG